MHDPDIRVHLIGGLKNRIPEKALIVEEMGINLGHVRADVSVLTPEKFIGYEIKSDFDSPARLARQVEYYSKIFDQAYLVVGPKKLHLVKKIVPDWWGIYTIYETPFGVEFRCRQQAQMNPGMLDMEIMIKLLWRDELLIVLTGLGLAAGLKHSTKRVLYAKLAAEINALGVDKLREIIYECLSARTTWR